VTAERAKAIVTTIQNLKPKRVFLIARWSLYANGWYVGGNLQPATHFLSTDPNQPGTLESSRKTLETKLPETIYAMAHVSPVVIVKTLPVLKADVEAIFLERTTPTTPAEHRERESFANTVIENTIRNSPPGLQPITILDPAQLLCSADRCAIAINNTVMYRDDNHITAQGALLFENEILREIK
jgi:hypothetical protein